MIKINFPKDCGSYKSRFLGIFLMKLNQVFFGIFFKGHWML